MARGKTKGATSFVSVPLGVLNSVLRPEASVMVSRRYAETLGLESDNIQVNTNDMKKEVEARAETIEFKTEDLNTPRSRWYSRLKSSGLLIIINFFIDLPPKLIHNLPHGTTELLQRYCRSGRSQEKAHLFHQELRGKQHTPDSHVRCPQGLR